MLFVPLKKTQKNKHNIIATAHVLTCFDFFPMQLPTVAMTTLKSAPGSRLPVRKARHQVERGVSAPSKLELMRQHYQEQLERAKEQKLRDLYPNNPPPSNKALLRLTNNNNDDDMATANGADNDDDEDDRGRLRDFFRERRALEGDNGRGRGQPKTDGYAGRYRKQQQKQQHTAIISARPPPGPQLRTGGGVGRDRSKPLAPIVRDDSNGSLGAASPSGTYVYDKEGNLAPFVPNIKLKSPGRMAGTQLMTAMPRTGSDPGDSERSLLLPPGGRGKSTNFREWQDQQKKRRDMARRAVDAEQTQVAVSLAPKSGS